MKPEMIVVTLPEDEARKQLLIWKKRVEEGYCWTFQTDIPHATFEIMDDTEHYCRGIVFSLADLHSPVAATTPAT